MSKLKFVPDLFLESIELNRFNKFLTTDGFYADFINNTEKFGIIKNNNIDPSFNNFRTVTGTNSGTIKILNGFAYNNLRERIILNQIDNISIPQDGKKYFIKISYLASPIEAGTVSISTGGYMTGVGTEFTKLLRGQPDFPSLIQFNNSVHNLLQYEVLRVIDDTNAQLSGVFTTAESALNYKIVGTFTPGVIVSTDNQFIYQYDSCTISIVSQDAVISGSYYPQLIKDKEFIIASVSNLGGVVTINDTRLDFILRTRLERLANEIPVNNVQGYNLQKQNPLMACTAIRKLVVNTVVFYQISLDWKFKVTSKTIDRINSQMTVTAGSGGAFKSVADFTNGDFDGWRLYYNNSGEYSTILSSVLSSGNILLTFDSIPQAIGSNLFTTELNNEGIYICPNAEEIEISYSIPLSDTATINLKDEKKLFKITSLDPQIFIRGDECYKNYQLTIPVTYNYKTLLKQPNY